MMIHMSRSDFISAARLFSSGSQRELRNVVSGSSAISACAKATGWWFPELAPPSHPLMDFPWFSMIFHKKNHKDLRKTIHFLNDWGIPMVELWWVGWDDGIPSAHVLPCSQWWYAKRPGWNEKKWKRVGKNWKRLHPDCDSVSDSVIDSFWIILGSVRRMKQNMLWPCWRLCQAHLHALRSCEVSPSQQLPQSVNGYPIWTMDISPEILRGFRNSELLKITKSEDGHPMLCMLRCVDAEACRSSLLLPPSTLPARVSIGRRPFSCCKLPRSTGSRQETGNRAEARAEARGWWVKGLKIVPMMAWYALIWLDGVVVWCLLRNGLKWRITQQLF